MTDSPRWERESQEDLRPPEQEPQQTTEPEIRLAGETNPGQLKEPPEYPAPAAESAPGSEEPQATQAMEQIESEEDADGWPDRDQRLTVARESLSATAAKVGRWLHSLDRRPEFDPGTGRDPVAELRDDDREPAPPRAGSDREREREHDPAVARDRRADHGERDREDHQDDEGGVRFPTAALGYNRQAVDSHIAELEQEIATLLERIGPPLSITEEIERLGEQTASILVVAHDKAHETARRAQEQAARAVLEASEGAERITSAAERRLRELDEETDAVWRERERLLGDVREVSRTLATLADAASERFPAAPEPVSPAATA